MRGWALTIAVVVGVAGAAGAAAAQSRWKQPNDLFSINVPAGWSINESQVNQWVIYPTAGREAGAGAEPAACILRLTENVSTMFRRQADLERMLTSAPFIETWRQSVAARVVDTEVRHSTDRSIHGLRYLHITASGRLRGARNAPAPAERGVVLMALALAPGQMWRMACVVTADGRAEPATGTIDNMLGSLRILDTTGATNAR